MPRTVDEYLKAFADAYEVRVKELSRALWLARTGRDELPPEEISTSDQMRYGEVLSGKRAAYILAEAPRTGRPPASDPKNTIVSFRINESERRALLAARVGGESRHKAAKRIVLAHLARRSERDPSAADEPE